MAATAPKVPQNIAGFAGAWKGAWGGSLPTALVVEQVDSNGTAKVIYSWGNEPDLGIKAGWTRQSGIISSNRLHLLPDDRVIIDFLMETNGTLTGLYEANGMPSFGTLTRLTNNDFSATITNTQALGTDWKEVRITERSQVGPTAGKTLTLQTTIYPVTTPGRHPVVIFNHGSTGPGIIPATMVFRGGSEEAFFHSLGYIEVVPMRKGRGNSDGPNVEEDFSLPPSVELDSALEDVQTVIDYLGTLPDVDTNRIVLSGVSRGGFLSVIYAGRHPAGIVGVINFSGGWFGEGMPLYSGFNFQEFDQAGHDAKVPMLWLYADHDSYYSLKFVESEFADFEKAGGAGDLVEVRDMTGEGHMLAMRPDKWRQAVTDYLNKIAKR